ncbi:MAG: proline--tRNA ligase [Candidatus Aminicenantes bacterium]|nr:proline--tRNA ligase [Candidatus Aminicenantes bacterium]
MNDQDRQVKSITPKSEDFSRWYQEIVQKAELADYTPMKGMMVIRPYGYAVWENVRDALDRRIKASGHVNAYFPLFIPESFLKKEAEHVEGFSPEVAWVTVGGKEELEERLAVRPTSEAIIGHMYAKWVKSWRDLPVLVNQWANIVRWEKVTRPFLRTTEFLWQEGHTCHETAEEGEAETLRILDLYRDVCESELAIPVLAGRKSLSEKFAGASMTYALEALMSDGKALQMGTSHNLGQHFSKAFDIKFEDRNQTLQYVWQTSWGMTTRTIGALIMVHGDDSGLRFPPRVAPVQAVVVPISVGNWKETVLPAAEAVVRDLRAAGLRVEIDAREEATPGWKFAEYEMRGVPLRIEIGPRDVKAGQAVLARRDLKTKETAPLASLAARVPALLDAIQAELLGQARAYLRANIRDAADYEAFKAILENERGFVRAPWCGGEACEARIKAETMATIRVIPLDEAEARTERPCVACGAAGQALAYFARSY